MTVALNAAQIWAAALTDEAVAAHLRRLVEKPSFFGKSQREALLTEAAQRLDGIRQCPGCGRTEKLNALSRFDNYTHVCSSCGTAEGIAALHGDKITAPGKIDYSEAKA